MSQGPTDYRSAGVDRDAGEAWLDELGSEIKRGFRKEVLSPIGGFGAIFESPKNYREPVWVASTDGVGTKLILAEEAGDESFFGIGIDCVAMCVNDLLACGAEPVVFLDYLATGKLNKNRNQHFLRGVLKGCELAGCSLVGGETAEMPGFYESHRMDVAGFSIGVMEKSQLSRAKAQVGDRVWGFVSNGFHSNGYSLIRKIFKEHADFLKTKKSREEWLRYLLQPTEIYVKKVLPLLRSPGARMGSHITGGGLVENLPREVADGLVLSLRRSAIPSSEPMKIFLEKCSLTETELYSTFNMGIGFCVIGDPSLEREAMAVGAIYLGDVVAGQGPARVEIV